jgi:hypothetical protein
MRISKYIFWCSTFLLHLNVSVGQIRPEINLGKDKTDTEMQNQGDHPCITSDQYSLIEKRCKENLEMLQQSGMIKNSLHNVVLLKWPLKATDSLRDCSFYRVSAYVDQNTATGSFQDFNCGTNTYDGHRGTDISIWPFNFYKMDHDLVEVVAAAPGIILDKHDGEFDKNCAGNNLTANYIIVRHSDGSQANYWHLKKNSLTKKAIGQTVSAGEFLGVVGSSGSSSGPHLHFEVWAGSTIATRIDPFSGTCNSLNSNSWWEAQKPYTETSIVKVSVNTTDIVLPPCPMTETLNESDNYQIPFQGNGLPPGFAKFYIFIRDEIAGKIADMSIVNPDGSTFASWSYTSSTASKTRANGTSKKLPTIPGKYTFKASYNGTECSKSFNIMSPTKTIDEYNGNNTMIYHNPTNGLFLMDKKDVVATELKIYNLLGANVYNLKIVDQITEINLDLPGNMYIYQVWNKNQVVDKGKILIK